MNEAAVFIAVEISLDGLGTVYSKTARGYSPRLIEQCTSDKWLFTIVLVVAQRFDFPCPHAFSFYILVLQVY